jgi:hypothetical protein
LRKCETSIMTVARRLSSGVRSSKHPSYHIYSMPMPAATTTLPK